MGWHMRIRVKDMSDCAMFSILVTIGAYIKIPIATPITLQTLFVVFAGLMLKKNIAVLSILLYIIIGLFGFPVFSSGGGLGYIMHPTFGYLLGFMIATYVISVFSENQTSFLILLMIALFAILVIYVCGFIYFYFIQNIYFKSNISFRWMFYYLFLIYLPGDIISCIIAVYLKKRLFFRPIRSKKL